MNYKCTFCRRKRQKFFTGSKRKNGSLIFIDSQGRILNSSSTCPSCTSSKKRDFRIKNRSKLMAKSASYKLTPKGWLVSCYSGMRLRCEGYWEKTRKSYEGLPILSKEEFYEWGMSQPIFHELLHRYIKAGKQRKYAPSIDRIDPKKGYVIGNMQWLTNSENASKSNRTRWLD